MKKITFMLMIMLMSISSYAQVSFYGFSQSTSAYAEVSAGATALPLVKADFYISPAQNIGFDFVYEGTTYTQFKMASDGFISFNMAGTSSITSNSLSDANATSRPIIAPLWDDLDGSGPTGAFAGYEVTGTAPNRVLTVEWRNWEWNYLSATAVISFQLKLHETTNVIDFAYRQETTAINNGSASIGIGSATGSGAGSYLNLTSVATPAVGSTTSATTLNAKPLTNTVYTFTPAVACTGTPDGGTLSPAGFALCSGNLPGTITATLSGSSGLTFQWEQSIDNFVTPVNAVGGSGATTLAYTPPAYDGVPKKYRLKVTCTASGLFAYSSVVSVDNPASPLTAASVTAATAVGNTSMTINFTAGSGGRRYVVVNAVNSFTNPVNGTVAPVVAGTVYAGTGEQIVYDGTGTSVSITGLICNTNYYIRVYEYLRCGTTPAFDYYYNVSTSATNPVSQLTAQPPVAALPVNNNFEGFTGSNLSAVFPGWIESAGASPSGTSSQWTNSSLLPVPTAKVNLYAVAKVGEWIISPLVNITAPSVLNFKAALTDFGSTSADAGIAGTDDSVQVMVSTDGCGATWTPIYTFDTSNQILNATLQDFSLPLDAYIGSSIQIAFKASEGLVNDEPDYDVHIGAVVIRKVPTCPEPTALIVSAITATTANVAFTAPAVSPALGYDYILTSTNTLPADNATVSGTIAAAAVSVSLGSLTPATRYYVWIRGKCSGTDVGPWSNSATFVTSCTGVTAFSENFDSYTTGTNSLPPCWRRTGSSQASYVTTGGVAPGSPANRFYMSANGSGANPTEAFAVLPPVTNLQAGTHRLKFKAYSTVADTYLDVGYFEDFTDVTTFVVLESLLLPGTAAANATELTVVPSALAAGINSLVFRNGGTGAGSASVYIDDVIWELTPTCADVVNIVVSDITSSTAYAEWEQTGGESGWQVIYGPSTVTNPNDPSIAGNIVSVTTQNAVVSALTPQTAYKLWVRSVCGSTNGAWIGPVAFTTLCAALPIPFSQNFESATTPAIPNCSSIQNAGTGNNWRTASTTSYGFSSKVLNYPYNADAAANAWFFTQGIQLVAGQSYDLTFKYGRDNSTGYIEKLKVNIGTVANFESMDQEVVDLPNVINTTAAESVTSFTVDADGVYYLGFNAYSIADQNQLYVDDILLDITPTCIKPTAVVLTEISNNQAKISWVESVTNAALGYQYVYSTTNTLPATLDATNSGTVGAGVSVAVINGLAANTTYYFWVRSLCSISDMSAFTNRISFKTACNDVAEFTENFDSYTTGENSLPNCWSRTGTAATAYVTTGGVAPGTAPNRFYMAANGSTPTEAYAILPSVSNLSANTHRLKFKAYATAAGRTMEVGYFENVTDVTTFVSLEILNLPSTAASSAIEFIVVPTDVPAGIKNLVFKNAGIATGSTTLYIDDVKWEAIPACAEPTSLVMGAVSTTTATFSWNASVTAPANGYEYVYATTNTIPALTPANSGTVAAGVVTATLENLNAQTTYYVWVRSVCSGTETSAWTSVVSFTTLCAVVLPEFTQDFATFVPACWSTAATGDVTTGPTGTAAGIWAADGFLNVGSTGAIKVNLYGTSRIGWLISPIVDLSAGSFKVNFEYGVTAWGATTTSAMGSDDSVQLLISEDAGATWSVVTTFNAASGITNQKHYYSSVIASTSTQAKFAFVATDGAVNDAPDYDFFIDNFNVKNVLAVPGFDNDSFAFYPNPVKDVLNLSYSKNISGVEVFNIIGQQVLVKTVNANQSKIDMTNLQAGTYLVKVSVDNMVKTIKVIKQ